MGLSDIRTVAGKSVGEGIQFETWQEPHHCTVTSQVLDLYRPDGTQHDEIGWSRNASEDPVVIGGRCYLWEVSGLRPSLRLRYLLLIITALASIAGILLTQQVGHPPAAYTHAAIPVVDGVASADTASVADTALPPDEEDRQMPAGGVHLQLCLAALAGALGLLLKFGPRGRAPWPGDSDTGPPSRTGIRASTSARAPAPVLSLTCVLRV
ncbi:hypothetical protein EP51_44955 (plasmid) [Rhodococcus opacus]|uniref:Uncharacterized protein n=1 Tax=Rhodococcus opacus TaxID=37919 RepID=A0A076F1B6_RHOOP|nr:hypothetical protein EP51_44955 [Rhodococcus opacus]